MFEELCLRPIGIPPSYGLHRMMVDAYCLQHADRYCASGKSLVAHLAGLCAAFEHNSRPRVLEALRRSLDGDRRIEKPELPRHRGAITIADACGAADAGELGLAVERWARTTWEAHAGLHPVARRWIQEALTRPSGRPER